MAHERQYREGVALTGRNRTGPPCSVGRPTASGGRPARRQRYKTTTDDDDRRQTLMSKTIKDVDIMHAQNIDNRFAVLT